MTAAKGIAGAASAALAKPLPINQSEKTRLAYASRLKTLMDEVASILKKLGRYDRIMVRRENTPYLNLILDVYGRFVLKEEEPAAHEPDPENFDVV